MTSLASEARLSSRFAPWSARRFERIVVEFFDCNCPHYKPAAPELERLIADDPNIRVVFRQWPILGNSSDFSARAALAARKQEKYEAFHWEPMTLCGQAEEASVLAAAEKVGLAFAC